MLILFSLHLEKKIIENLKNNRLNILFNFNRKFYLKKNVVKIRKF